MSLKSISLIPYTCGAGGSVAGAAEGPLMMKRMKLHERLAQSGLDVVWAEDPEDMYNFSPWGRSFHDHLPPLGDKTRQEAVLWHAGHLRDSVAEAVGRGALPVTLGGDHSMAAGSVAGLAQAREAHGRIGLIWVDAHPDINTPQTSFSHALHGMPMAALLGMGDSGMEKLGGGKQPVLRPEHVFYLGLRDIDKAETKHIEDLGIRAYSGAEVAGIGVAKAFQEALATVSKDTDHLFLSIDLDAFDPSEAPAVGTPVSGGLHRENVFPALTDLVKAASFDVIELAEFNPALPGADQTYGLLADLLTMLLPAAR